MKRILLISGPNLNLLGTREPAIYGSETLEDVQQVVERTAAEYSLEVRAMQSNHEGVIIDAIHEARGNFDAIIINPGGLTHTSVALRDALAGVEIPFGEIHISNVHAREEFRHHSFLSSIAEFVIAGAGVQGYEFAVRRMATILSR